MAALHRLLAAGAGLLALAAVIAGDFRRPRLHAESHPIGVLELAAALRDRHPLLLVDARPPHQREAFSLPTAVGLEQARETIAGDDLRPLVLYGHEGSRSWYDLLEGDRKVRFLANGVAAWLDEVISPTLSPSASADERLAFQPQAELSRYFGGVPRYRDPDPAPLDVGDRIAQLERRGCGF